MATNDIYRGFPPHDAQSLASSSSSSSLPPRAGLGALAAVVEHAISRWARRRSSSSSSSSFSSLPSRSSATINNRSKSIRYGRDTIFHSPNSEREFSAHIALVKARKTPRQVPRQFTLYLPPQLLSGRHRPDLPHGFTTTTSLPLILGQLDVILRRSLKTGRTHGRDQLLNKDLSSIGRVARDRKGKKRVDCLPAILECDLCESSPKAWYLDVASPSWEDLREIGKLLHLHPLTLEDILQNEPSEKLESFPKLGYYFISFRAIATRNTRENTDHTHGEDPVGETNVYLTVFKDGICSFHFTDISEHTDRVRLRVQRLGEVFNMSAGMYWIAHSLLDSIVDSFFPYIEEIDKEIAAIDKLIFSGHNQRYADEISSELGPTTPPEKGFDTTGDDQKSEIMSEKSEFGDNDSRRIRYSITCLSALNLSRYFRRPASQCKKTPTDNLVQNSKNTLRRIARVRRLVTLLGRLLATKSEVIAQIRKRLLADSYFKVGAKSNLDALDIAMHMDDVQDHIFTLQHSLAHYERMLGQLHPTYLSQLRTDLVITKSGESKALFYLTSITVAVLCIQSYVGIFSLNVYLPHNDRVPSGSYHVFAIVMSVIIIILILYTVLVYHWYRRAKRRHRVRL
ncbi:hypothetical protein F5887DRAFT_877931 [Amanita rubescens]|nr:hypothetical protein F5887DRAFT_877931 [Amanita rubescens]